MPVRADKILLADKIIYVAVEFPLLRGAEFYALTHAPGMPSGRQGASRKCTFERA